MALDESLRSRLEALNRGALPAVRVTPSKAAKAGHSGRPGEPASAGGRSAWRAGIVRPIPGLVRRGHVVSNDTGEHWRICLPVDELWPGGEELIGRRHESLAAVQQSSEADAPAWWAGLPHDVVFLDLETCGLSGAALFLAGVLHSVEGRLTVELLLARNYAEESAVLASLWQRLANVRAIVTFNGKSFDWPMVVDRSRRHLLSRGVTVAPPQHVDLLHIARRRWRKELPDCKLQTLERRICGRQRDDDMPSSQIPAAYQQYVRTGFEREMDQILLHNAIDLVTMLDLAMRLAGGESDIVTSRSAETSDRKSANRTPRPTSG